MPRFLGLDRAIEIHRVQIEDHGGGGGVRDMGLLESALAMPCASFAGQFAHADAFEMAAAYLFHIAKNHPFVDGNKRTAAMTADVFLRLNGHSLRASGAAYEALVLRVASSAAGKAGAAGFFRRHCRPSSRRRRRSRMEEE